MDEVNEVKEKGGKQTDTQKRKNLSADVLYEMSKERTHLAYENNTMSWIRTALSLVGFGIGIYEVAEKTGGTLIFRSSKLVGIFLISLGMCSLIAAIYENRRNHKSLSDNKIQYERNYSLAIRIGIVLILISGFALVRILIRTITGN